MKKTILGLLVCAAMIPALDAQEKTENLNEYRFVRQALRQISEGNAEGAVIAFDPLLFSGTNSEYSNIRILDSKGKEVPYAVRDLRPRKKVMEYSPLSGKIESFSLDAKTNTATLVYSLSSPSDSVARILLGADTPRFDKKVTVEFLNADGKVISRTEELPFFRYGPVFGDYAVTFRPEPASKLRISISNFTETRDQPAVKVTSGDKNLREKTVRADEFGLGRVEVFSGRNVFQQEAPEETTYSVHPVSRTEHGTVTEMVFAANRIPFTSVKVASDTPRFDRRFELFLKSRDVPERKIASGRLVSPESDVILPGVRGDYAILRIQNGNDAPLENLRLEWIAPKKAILIVPPAAGGDVLTLLYGGNANPRLYDIEQYADKFGLPAQVYTLGEQKEAASYAPAVPKDRVWRWVMYAILVAAGIVLFVSIVRALNGKNGGDGGAQ